MAGIRKLSGHGTFWSDDIEHIKLWNRLEFRKGKDWAEVWIASMEPGGKSDVIRSRLPMVVLFVGWIMAVIIECGGDDVTRIAPQPNECPAGCEHGYIRLDDGNYERCPICGADHSS